MQPRALPLSLSKLIQVAVISSTLQITSAELDRWHSIIYCNLKSTWQRPWLKSESLLHLLWWTSIASCKLASRKSNNNCHLCTKVSIMSPFCLYSNWWKGKSQDYRVCFSVFENYHQVHFQSFTLFVYWKRKNASFIWHCYWKFVLRITKQNFWGPKVWKVFRGECLILHTLQSSIVHLDLKIPH